MTWVALETSSRAPSVAVADGDEVHSVNLEGERAHASDLVPALERLFSELGRTPREISGVLVGTGPGSYTGLRVGIATALGIARATGAVLRGVPSGETVAFGELEPGGECAFLLDARQGQLYFALYRREEREVAVLHAPEVVVPERARELLRPGLPIFGDAAAAEVAGLGPETCVRPAPPRAAELLALGRARIDRLGPQASDAVEPLYLRPFAAKTRRR